jgi:hypothetical protein
MGHGLRYMRMGSSDTLIDYDLLCVRRRMSQMRSHYQHDITAANDEHSTVTCRDRLLKTSSVSWQGVEKLKW